MNKAGRHRVPAPPRRRRPARARDTASRPILF